MVSRASEIVAPKREVGALFTGVESFGYLYKIGYREVNQKQVSAVCRVSGFPKIKLSAIKGYGHSHAQCLVGVKSEVE